MHPTNAGTIWRKDFDVILERPFHDCPFPGLSGVISRF